MYGGDCLSSVVGWCPVVLIGWEGGEWQDGAGVSGVHLSSEPWSLWV